MNKERSRLRRVVMLSGILLVLGIAAVEVSDSNLVLGSKSYEIFGYREVHRESADAGSTLVYKQKRFAFLPGEPTVVYTHDAAGRTLARQAVLFDPARFTADQVEQSAATVASDTTL